MQDVRKENKKHKKRISDRNKHEDKRLFVFSCNKINKTYKKSYKSNVFFGRYRQ